MKLYGRLLPAICLEVSLRIDRHLLKYLLRTSWFQYTKYDIQCQVKSDTGAKYIEMEEMHIPMWISNKADKCVALPPALFPPDRALDPLFIDFTFHSIYVSFSEISLRLRKKYDVIAG